MYRIFVFLLMSVFCSVSCAKEKESKDKSVTMSTDYHTWTVNGITAGKDETILYETCYPLAEKTYIYYTDNEYLEDIKTGRRFYVKRSDLGTKDYPTILINKKPFDFKTYFEPIPDDVIYVRFFGGTKYYDGMILVRNY